MSGYYSQYGQDKWIYETLCDYRDDGVFVDIGAHDGVRLSNTLFLERAGWTGVAVEPLPEVFESLQANRSCHVVNGCVGRPAGVRSFRRVKGYSEMLSGLVDECSPDHRARIDREIASHGGQAEIIKVQCFDFNELMCSFGVTKINYLSIDVEGGEHAILESIDFDAIDIEIIGAENNYDKGRLRRLMSARGYKLHSRVGDDFFVKS